MGDGSLLMNIMRQCHQKLPNIPLLVSTKEISMEDVRLGLEKLPDRFVEHKNTVFVISNLNYVESTNLKSNNPIKQKKMNWKIVKLKGNSSLDFSTQLRKLNQEFLAKKWQVERNPKSGNPTYKEPSVIVIYRKDQEFVLKNVIPKQENGKNEYDIIIASQPYRSRVSAEKKVKFVIEPNARFRVKEISVEDPFGVLSQLQIKGLQEQLEGQYFIQNDILSAQENLVAKIRI